MANNANEVSREVKKWSSWRDRCCSFHEDGLLYDQLIAKGILKSDTCALFNDPTTNNSLEGTTKTVLIHWCNHNKMKLSFSDRWYMLFDKIPCNNNEVPLYFLRKLYCEFILGEMPNYFNFYQFQDRVRGST